MDGAAKVNGVPWSKGAPSPQPDFKPPPAPNPAEGMEVLCHLHLAEAFWISFPLSHFPSSFQLPLIPAIPSIGIHTPM